MINLPNGLKLKQLTWDQLKIGQYFWVSFKYKPYINDNYSYACMKTSETEFISPNMDSPYAFQKYNECFYYDLVTINRRYNGKIGKIL